MMTREEYGAWIWLLVNVVVVVLASGLFLAACGGGSPTALDRDPAACLVDDGRGFTRDGSEIHCRASR